MSIDKSYYVIAGYDLTDLKTDKYEKWKWTDEGEKFLCNQCKGNIQLFDDPMSDSYLYFGKILAAGDEYYFKTTKFDIQDILNSFEDVTQMVNLLRQYGVIEYNRRNIPIFQTIVFEECR
jgi:hypothetical protein